MRWLIDGYNLMHALGLMRKKFGPEQFHKARQKFLDRVADGLGAVESYQSVVVFDAGRPPLDQPSKTRHKGLEVLFAVGFPTADERIEQILDDLDHPRAWTVVSSDARVRQAATRHKARAWSNDQFLDELFDRAERRQAAERAEHGVEDTATRLKPTREEHARERGLNESEVEQWMSVFADLEDDEDTREALEGDRTPFWPTEDEVKAMEREIDEELRRALDGSPRRPPGPPKAAPPRNPPKRSRRPQ